MNNVYKWAPYHVLPPPYTPGSELYKEWDALKLNATSKIPTQTLQQVLATAAHVVDVISKGKDPYADGSESSSKEASSSKAKSSSSSKGRSPSDQSAGLHAESHEERGVKSKVPSFETIVAKVAEGVMTVKDKEASTPEPDDDEDRD